MVEINNIQYKYISFGLLAIYLHDLGVKDLGNT
jgi:hypothetical protein